MSKEIEFKTEIDQSRLKFVDDELIGYLSFKNEWKFELRPDFSTHFVPASNCRDQHNIVIILESPHIYEFENVDLILKNTETNINSRPLNNSSSRNKLIDLLNGVFKDYLTETLNPTICYNIILVNSIQYQCSLGEDTKLHRDKLFLWNWIDLKTNFIDRIRILNPAYFINCCTKGIRSESKSYLTKDRIKEFGFLFDQNEYLFDVRKHFGKEEFTLQGLVERELELSKLITNANYFKYDHPSSRFEGGYKVIEKSNQMYFSKETLGIQAIKQP